MMTKLINYFLVLVNFLFKLFCFRFLEKQTKIHEAICGQFYFNEVNNHYQFVFKILILTIWVKKKLSQQFGLRNKNNFKKIIIFFISDNIDTRETLNQIRELVTFCNIYSRTKKSSKLKGNRLLLKNIASYITKLFKVIKKC